MRVFDKMIVKFLALVLILGTSLFAKEYSFSVKNGTETAITKILVSQDGKSWGFFDIGKGITPGETMTLIWDASTNDQDCKQYIKAVWLDGSEADPAIFDFCEEGLAIEF